MRKRIGSVLLALCMALTLLPARVWAEEPATSGQWGNLTWSLDTATGNLTISGTGDMPDAGEESPPFSHLGYYYTVNHVAIGPGVTSIGRSAFDGFRLTSVSIPDSVTSIGDRAFAGSGLTSVTIPDSVTSVGELAFASCNSLASVTFSGDIGSIGAYAFEFCSSLTSLAFNGTVGSIGEYAFRSCGGLTGLSFPHEVDLVGPYSFDLCGGLTSLAFSADVGQIGECAFRSCYGLTGVTFSGAVGAIGERAFELNGKLAGVTFSGAVGSIGEYAFQFCRELAGVSFSSTVDTVGGYAFSNCENLTSVEFRGDVGAIQEGAFSFCGKLADPTFAGAVGSIGDSAFSYCEGLTRLSFPQGVGSVEGDAFFYCRGLTAVYLKSADSIHARAFLSCDQLGDIYFGGSDEDWAKCGGPDLRDENASLPVAHTGVPEGFQFPGTEAGDLDALRKRIADGTGCGRAEVELTAGIDLGGETLLIPKDCRLVLDLKGHDLTSSASPAVEVKGELTLLDSTVTQAPVVNGTTVTYASGGIYATQGHGVYVQPLSAFTMLSGRIEAAGRGVTVYSDQSVEGFHNQSTAQIENGYVKAEASALTALGNGAELKIRDSVLVSEDGAVISGGEEEGQGGTSIEVRNAVLIGRRRAGSRELPCGIYHPQDGSVFLGGTEIYAQGGIGVLMRGGSLSVHDYGKRDTRVYAGGSGTGAVGTGRELPAGYLVMDQAGGFYDRNRIRITLAENLRYPDEFAITGYPAEGFGLRTVRYSGGDSVYSFGRLCTITFRDRANPDMEIVRTSDANGKIQWPEDPVREGYVFRGWSPLYASNSLKDIVDPSTCIFNNDRTLEAQWTPVGAHLIKFEWGGSSAWDVKATGIDGVLLDWPRNNPQRLGQVFVGWHTQAEGGERVPFDQVFTGDTTVYAHWGQPVRPHTITFDPNDGGSAPETRRTDTEGRLAAGDWPSPPARAGYTFRGWSLLRGYMIGVSGDYEFYEDSTLYARWIPNDGFAVTFDAKNGSAAETRHTDTAGVLPQKDWPADPELDAQHTFGGWYTVSDGKYISLVEQDTAFQRDTELYAYWIENGGDGPVQPKPVYKITFSANEEVFAVMSTRPGGGLSGLPDGKPDRQGYAFAGWYTGKEDGDPVTASYMFQGDATVYAHWTKKTDPGGGDQPDPGQTTFTVSFNSQGGSAVAAQTVASGGRVNQPAAPTRTGYTFGGWYQDAACTSAWSFAAHTVTKDVTLYAKWTGSGGTSTPGDSKPSPSTPGTSTPDSSRRYTVTFDANGGSGGTTLSTGTSGRLSALPTANPTRAGYTFGGWYTAASGGSRVTTSTVFSADTTVYARWSQNADVFLDTDYQIYTPASAYGGTFDVSHSAAAAGTVVTVSLSPWNTFELSRLTVTRTDTGRAVPLTRRYGGQYTFVMPASDVRVGVAYTERSAGGYSEAPASAKPVNWYFSNGCIYHVKDGIVPFASPVTRDMLISVLYNMDGSSFGDPTTWAAGNGVIPDIYDSWLWGEDKAISREQTAMILYCYARHMNYNTAARASLDGYIDRRQIRSAAQPAVSWSRAAGLITGTSANTLSPQDFLTCEQANSILSRFVTNVAGGV